MFLLLSALFGSLALVLTPPLRGPDELPHFLRAYGLTQGEIVPDAEDESRRKGLLIPGGLHQEIQLYEQALAMHYRGADVSYRSILAEHRRLVVSAPPATQPVFVPYAGSEGYSPVPYLPYLPGLALARLLDLNFVSMLMVTRASGLILITAVMVIAIGLLPRLRWPFLLIGLIPSALFSRAVLSADGLSLALVMAVSALVLRDACRLNAGSPGWRALLMALCVLSKPPQLAFLLLEAMRRPRASRRGRWRSAAAVVLPALVLAAAWTLVSDADVASWRIVDGSTRAAEEYEPLWKLGFLLQAPWHFPMLLAGTWHYADDYLLQLVGILGWLDMPLRPFIYPVIGASLVFALCGSLDVAASTRRRLVIVAALTVLGYLLAVFLIFYLVWTGLDAAEIDGVQGRYFVVVLPVIAILVAARLERGFSEQARAWAAITGALVSGCATVDAVLRVHWNT
jgi:uncharacterized membrane protein